MRAYTYIAIFALLLAAPLAAHWMTQRAGSDSSSPQTGAAIPRLVIITPNSQDIRNEFRWAFADWYRKKFGSDVDVEYLNPGSTNDIERQLQLKYREIRNANGGKLPPENQIDLGIDLVWGGGDYAFNNEMKPLGIFRPLDLDPQILHEVFPNPTLAGVKLYDQEKDASGQLLAPKWVGTCLSSFGIVFNPDLYKSMAIPFPATWSDLADPRLFGAIALADPTHSASVAAAYMMVLQRAMADAETEFLRQPQNKGIAKEKLLASKAYSEALDAGWSRGMANLALIAANARYFTDSASVIPNDVAAGDSAAGMAIDFYARTTEQVVGLTREQFVFPVAATAITPDPIAILYGTHGDRLKLAQQFIQFVLSEQGQRLWILNPGQPGGPRVRSLRRPPIRLDVYADRAGWADDVNYFHDSGGFNQRGAWMATFSDLRVIWAAAWIDVRDDMRAGYQKILALPDGEKRTRLIAQFAALPITRGDVAQLMADRKKIEADPSSDSDLWKAQQRMNWAQKFREHYKQVAAEADRG